MMTTKPAGHRWLVVALYAVAMAWFEAAAVYYLRSLFDRIDPYQPYPLPMADWFGEAELIREIATLIMLFTVGWLAGATWRTRLGYSVVAFGVWDIFYYVFLRVMTGWPKSLLDWDILFLIPLPWWGPVWAPTSIALLMILWGTFMTKVERSPVSFGSRWKCLALGGRRISQGRQDQISDPRDVVRLRFAREGRRHQDPKGERQGIPQSAGGHRIPGTLIGLPLSKAVR